MTLLRNLNTPGLLELVTNIIPALLCITFHELSHGFVAYKLGDNTARDMGRLTLNPVKHIDPIGLLMMIFASFGWAKPVPVNPRNFKNPKRGMAITAAAGPVSNILLAAVFFVIFGVIVGLGHGDGIVSDIIVRTAVMSVGLAVFNILPIPPLDGSKVLFSLLPNEAYGRLLQYERYGFIVLIIVIYTGVLDGTIGAVARWIITWLSYIVRFVSEIVMKIAG